MFRSVETTLRGKGAEQRFIDMVKQRNMFVRVSTPREDREDHIDVWVEPPVGAVDVKSRKKIARADDHVNDEWVWTEIKGVHKTPGWLFGGKADHIAFEEQNGFLLVPRKELLKYVEATVIPICNSNPPVESPYQAMYRYYSRWGRNDQLVLLQRSKLAGLKDVLLWSENEK